MLVRTVARAHLEGGAVSLEDLRGCGGRELLAVVLALAVVVALFVVALVDWVAA